MPFLFYWGLLMLAADLIAGLLLVVGRISLAQVPYFIGVALLVSAALARLISAIHVAWEERKRKAYIEAIKMEAERFAMKYAERQQRELEAITMDDVVDALRKLGREHIVEE